MKNLWPGVPRTLYICSDAQKYGTTYERLCLHLVLDHGLGEQFVEQRGQTELENIHNSYHAKGSKANHKHDRPVLIVGYEVKDEQPTMGE